MQFYRKLAELRKAAGMSQEELAERADVSRQTVFKWEAGLTTPSMENILSLCRIFGVSADELIGNEPEADLSGGAEKKEEAKEGKSDDQIPAPVPFPRFRYEYKSRRTLFGLPLVHICLGTGRCRAKGILAVGNEAVGIVAVGIASLGVFSIGAVSAGLFAIAALSLAALSVGAIAVGVLAVGSVAVGVYVCTGMLSAKYDVKAYNKECASDDLPGAEAQAAEGEEKEGRAERISSAVCGVIMLVATAVFLLLGFLRNWWHPGWVCFVVGGILCGIVNIVAGAFSKD